MSFRIYTKTGDSGQTGLYGGERVPKDHIRIESYGTVDELNSQIGLLRAFLNHDGAEGSLSGQAAEATHGHDPLLGQIQASLFTIGSQLATPFGKTPPVQPISTADTALLENAIDQLDTQLPDLTSFILPAGQRATCQAHVCRTVARRAERCVVHLDHEEPVDPEIVVYLNRLSDYFFTLARAITHEAGERDTPWAPRA